MSLSKMIWNFWIYSFHVISRFSRYVPGLRVIHLALTDFAANRLGSIYKIMIKDHY